MTILIEEWSEMTTSMLERSKAVLTTAEIQVTLEVSKKVTRFILVC
jgi:hypothetical protein